MSEKLGRDSERGYSNVEPKSSRPLESNLENNKVQLNDENLYSYPDFTQPQMDQTPLSTNNKLNLVYQNNNAPCFDKFSIKNIKNHNTDLYPPYSNNDDALGSYRKDLYNSSLPISFQKITSPKSTFTTFQFHNKSETVPFFSFDSLLDVNICQISNNEPLQYNQDQNFNDYGTKNQDFSKKHRDSFLQFGHNQGGFQKANQGATSPSYYYSSKPSKENLIEKPSFSTSSNKDLQKSSIQNVSSNHIKDYSSNLKEQFEAQHSQKFCKIPTDYSCGPNDNSAYTNINKRESGYSGGITKISNSVYSPPLAQELPSSTQEKIDRVQMPHNNQASQDISIVNVQSDHHQHHQNQHQPQPQRQNLQQQQIPQKIIDQSIKQNQTTNNVQSQNLVPNNIKVVGLFFNGESQKLQTESKSETGSYRDNHIGEFNNRLHLQQDFDDGINIQHFENSPHIPRTHRCESNQIILSSPSNALTTAQIIQRYKPYVQRDFSSKSKQRNSSFKRPHLQNTSNLNNITNNSNDDVKNQSVNSINQKSLLNIENKEHRGSSVSLKARCRGESATNLHYNLAGSQQNSTYARQSSPITDREQKTLSFSHHSAKQTRNLSGNSPHRKLSQGLDFSSSSLSTTKDWKFYQHNKHRDSQNLEQFSNKSRSRDSKSKEDYLNNSARVQNSFTIQQQRSQDLNIEGKQTLNIVQNGQISISVINMAKGTKFGVQDQKSSQFRENQNSLSQIVSLKQTSSSSSKQSRSPSNQSNNNFNATGSLQIIKQNCIDINQILPQEDDSLKDQEYFFEDFSQVPLENQSNPANAFGNLKGGSSNSGMLSIVASKSIPAIQPPQPVSIPYPITSKPSVSGNTASYYYQFSINSQLFPHIPINLEEVKRDRQQLIKKIQNTFQIKNQAPATSQEFYKILTQIGQGAFAKVHLAIQILTGQFVALKIIDKNILRSDSAQKRVIQEVEILKLLGGGHRNLIQLLEVFENQNNIFIVMEFFHGSDLMKLMNERNGEPMSENQIKMLMCQIVSTLFFIQSNHIIHRDIKLDNVLIDQQCTIKLIDFGISRVVTHGAKMTEQCGTPAYLAPEIIINRGYQGFSSDTWSLGVMLYIMLLGQVPFQGNNIHELHKNILNGVYPAEELVRHQISEEGRDLISQMLKVNPKQRIDTQGIINHPWFSSQKINTTNFNYLTFNQEYEESSIAYMESIGYSREYIFHCLDQQGLSHVNAIYNLLNINNNKKEFQI